MKAAVIGANGYIARNLLHVDRTEHFAVASAYGRSPKHMDDTPGYRMLDLTDREDMERAIADCDVIYWFVGKTGTLRGFDSSGEFVDVNEKLLLRFLDAYRSVGSQAKIVFPSTRLVYRGSDRPLTEEAPKQFLTPYAMQKYACEKYLEMYSRLYDVRYCILRICVPYGSLVQPVTSYGTLDFFLRQARECGQVSIYGDGRQRRTLTYIGDLCRIFWQIGADERCVNDVYNAGGEELSIRQLAGYVAEAYGAKVVERPWPADAWKVESGSTVFDAKKLEGRLDCRPTMTVERWIKSMAESRRGGGNI